MLHQLKGFFRARNKQRGQKIIQQQPVNVISYNADMKPMASPSLQRRQPPQQHQPEPKIIDQSMPSSQTQATSAAEAEERQAAAEIAAKWIEEERQRKARLPRYAGLERYEIIKKLGDGAFSNVYKARDIQTGRKVAIKVVKKHEIDDDGHFCHLHPSMKRKPRATERANILKEVQIMRNIKHPNIVQLLQFTESKEHYYLVLELCEGGELFHRIVKLTYFSEALARHVITQVAEGVRYLHEECGVVHRDIKPENILFDPIAFIPSAPQQRFNYGFDEHKEDEGVFIKGVGGGGIGTVKLADFGLSKVIWDSSTWTPCGTVGYTAPEIVRDQRYSKSVDMWAIGCVLYTLLCGFPPFYDESIHTLTDKVACGQYSFLSPWWDPISDSAKDLISHLLCVDPDKRYTIHQFFRHPWITQEEKANETTSAKELQQSHHYSPTPSTIVSTPSSSTRRRDVFSPGAPAIKEILDITYAVQRMGEEEKTLRGDATAVPAYDHRQQGHDHHTTTTNMTQGKQKTAMKRQKAVAFELNLDNATLLKNRRVNH